MNFQNILKIIKRFEASLLGGMALLARKLSGDYADIGADLLTETPGDLFIDDDLLGVVEIHGFEDADGVAEFESQAVDLPQEAVIGRAHGHKTVENTRAAF